jgi:hypothetical protein
MSTAATASFLVRAVSPQRGRLAFFFDTRSAAESKARALREQGYLASVEQLPAINGGVLDTIPKEKNRD